MLRHPRDPFGPCGKDLFDPEAYPKAHVMSAGNRAFFFVHGGAFLVVAVALTLKSVLVTHGIDAADWWWLIVVYPMATLELYYAIRFRVVLYADAIEMRGVWRSRQLQFEDISGRRMLYPTKSVPSLVLVPRELGRRTLKVPIWAAPDIAFRAWVTRLPDLDVKDETHS